VCGGAYGRAVTTEDVAAVVAREYARISGDAVADVTPLRLPGFGDAAHPELDLDSLGFLELLASVEEAVEVEFADGLRFDGMRTAGDLVAAIVAAVAAER